MLADEYETDDAVAVLFVPHFHEVRVFAENALLHFFVFGSEPGAEILGRSLLAGLFEQETVVAVVFEPHKSLGADDTCGVVVQQHFEAFADERAAAFVHERADAIFVAMRMVLVVVVAAVAHAVFMVAMAVIFVFVVVLIVVMFVMIMVMMFVFIFVMVVMMMLVG